MTKEEWFDNSVGLPISSLIKLGGQYRKDSLVSAIEGIVLEKYNNANADLNEAELTVLAVEAMEREVNNGGFVAVLPEPNLPFFSESGGKPW